MKTLLPPGWPRPKGYANGVTATGRMVFVAGMIGWGTHRACFTATTWPSRCARPCKTWSMC